MGNRSERINHASVSEPWAVTQWTEYVAPVVPAQRHNRPVAPSNQNLMMRGSPGYNPYLNRRGPGIRQQHAKYNMSPFRGGNVIRVPVNRHGRH
ncbi:unnamed protein product [Adineta ricciae]|uniref:Uncharacterized protein n=1 Tax=Adineta ricciae TaxID=249248 RepID=A0A815QSM5_ADIRI|nr:unnamed protein product [Adineta ricciae]CAF1467620.1 unnamed protein product [Adineta ricciae]